MFFVSCRWLSALRRRNSLHTEHAEPRRKNTEHIWQVRRLVTPCLRPVTRLRRRSKIICKVLSFIRFRLPSKQCLSRGVAVSTPCKLYLSTNGGMSRFTEERASTTPLLPDVVLLLQPYERHAFSCVRVNTVQMPAQCTQTEHWEMINCSNTTVIEVFVQAKVHKMATVFFIRATSVHDNRIKLELTLWLKPRMRLVRLVISGDTSPFAMHDKLPPECVTAYLNFLQPEDFALCLNRNPIMHTWKLLSLVPVTYSISRDLCIMLIRRLISDNYFLWRCAESNLPWHIIMLIWKLWWLAWGVTRMGIIFAQTEMSQIQIHLPISRARTHIGSFPILSRPALMSSRHVTSEHTLPHVAFQRLSKNRCKHGLRSQAAPVVSGSGLRFCLHLTCCASFLCVLTL